MIQILHCTFAHLLMVSAILAQVPSGNQREQNKQAPATSADGKLWMSIKDSQHPEHFEAFVKLYPNSEYAPAAQILALRLKSERINPKDGQKYIWISPGKFAIGCSQGDMECFENEHPAHEVKITKGFWMAQTPVTVGAWKRVTKLMPPEAMLEDRPLNPNWSDIRLPIVNVTWDMAKAYCEVVATRLPTEAEWEYAARAGTTVARYGYLDEIAWYVGNSGNQRLEATELPDNDMKGYVKGLNQNGNGLRAVATKRPNAWNLYDMLGNVWQWTADWYAEHYVESDYQDPHGPSSGRLRVQRGGAWGVRSRFVRLSVRSAFEPGYRAPVTGFRCVGE